MAKLAALLLVAHASATFSTTIEADNDNSPSCRSGQCRQEIQQRDLSHCTRFLREQQKGHRRGSVEELMMDAQENFLRCCNELRMIREERCRCKGLRKEMEQEQGYMGQREMRQMLQSARRLPNMCRVGPSECDFEMSSY